MEVLVIGGNRFVGRSLVVAGGPIVVPRSAAVTEAIALVMRTVGKNACSPSCGASPTPAFCR